MNPDTLYLIVTSMESLLSTNNDIVEVYEYVIYIFTLLIGFQGILSIHR